MTAQLILKRNRKRRLEQGHPWVYQSEIEQVPDGLSPGDVVDIRNHQGVFLAKGYVNPNSQIIARVLTYDEQEQIDTAFFVRRLQRAKAYRLRWTEGADSCRLIYGEADFLPGLIVDKYDQYLAVQILSFGMEVQKSSLLEGLIQVFHPAGIVFRNDVPVRALEGLDQSVSIAYGDVPDRVTILENGLKFEVDLLGGQKTGYFFDQRENRRTLEPLMTGWGLDGLRGAEMLECFCHTGAFTIHALKYGAQHVTAVDISEPAIEVAEQNAVLNGFSDRVDFMVVNAFDFLRDANQSNQSYDVVLLDPPAFAKSKRAVEGALRGYKEINLRGMRLTREGGYLVTASCSYHVSPTLFQETILDAAADAHKILRLVHWSGAGKDHPTLAGVDEGDYLKFAIYQVFSRK